MESKKFGDWAVVFWNKGSETLHIAQNQGEPDITDFWMVGTTTRQADYESGWLPNKKWTSTIKGHFSKDQAIQMAKKNVEKSLKESKYVDKDIEPLGKKLSHHSDDGFIDFCTAKVLDDLNKGDKKKLDFYEFWDWAAEVGSKDIVELIYNDFKSGKLAKDSAVCRFYKTYEDIKDLSLKDPKKFVKQYGWAYEDKIKDKSLKESAEQPIEACWIRNGHLIDIEDEMHGTAFLIDPAFFGISESAICSEYDLRDLEELRYNDDYENETHPAWDEMMDIALEKGAIRCRYHNGETFVTYGARCKKALINAMLDFPEAFRGRLRLCPCPNYGIADGYPNLKTALKALKESKKLKEDWTEKSLIGEIHDWIDSEYASEDYAPGTRVMIDLGDDWSAPDYQVVEKIDDWLWRVKCINPDNPNFGKIRSSDCIKVFKESKAKAKAKVSKRDICKEVEDFVNEAVEKTYNDSTKLSLMDYGVCIDKYGTKVFMLSGGLNGEGKWNEYLQTLAQFTVELIDKLQLKYGKDADVWLINLKNDCADDIFYPVFGFKVGEELDETESVEWQEQNTWQADEEGEEIPFEYDECTEDWNDGN